ncbi:MAG: hypothetical protein DME60_12700 [Verrucomicrobia bacterium]|nr:MAG: hypothetical protein DME60_12700 [Verrucomicrobiota bacterium]
MGAGGNHKRKKTSMTNLIHIINAICSGENSRSRPPLRCGFLLIALVLAWFTLAPQARAVCQEACLTNDNTLFGEDTLINVTTGTDNVALGHSALSSNTTGLNNTATGDDALTVNISGFNNTGIGWHALDSNTIGVKNTGIGCDGLSGNTTGSNNTAVGTRCLVKNTNGNNNVAMGLQAGENNVSGSNNVLLGFSAGRFLTNGSNNIDIGNPGVAGESNTIRIGQVGTGTATFIAGINGTAVAGGVTVLVNSNGQLGTMISSERFKDAIEPMDKASESILALKPVTFHYKQELDPQAIPQFGLVAEQVEKVNPDLVARDAQGKPYTVRYEAVNAMLLNEFLKEHRKVQELDRKGREQEAAIAQQQKEIQALTASLKEQASKIQKVSDQLEVSRAASRVVVNNE